MEVELKVVKLTKSKIKQMDIIGIPKNLSMEVLGWVNMDKKRWVIVQHHGSFYRAEFILKVDAKIQGTQFALPGGGYEFPHLTHINCTTYNIRSISFSPNRDEHENLKLYAHLTSFKKRTEIAGQIYY